MLLLVDTLLLLQIR